MAHLNNLTNPYQRELGAIFDECPKSVCAAIAVSALTVGGDFVDEAALRFAREWSALYQAGIVQQRPSPNARALMAQNPEEE